MKESQHLKVTPGDTIELEQDDGEKIQVIVYNNGFIVKAPDVGTKLDITKRRPNCVSTRTVKAGSG